MRIMLETLAGRYAVCRLPEDAPLPEWAGRPSGVVCVCRTDEELSIITDERHVEPDVHAERGFVAMRIVGELNFQAVGILASLTSALAEAAIPVLAVSTFRTDILLVRDEHVQRAVAALAEVADVLPGA